MEIKSFDKNYFLYYLYFLAKERKVKIGDLEKAAGVSAGYLARLGKEDNNSIPSVETVYKMAQSLGVTTDYFLHASDENLTPKEEQVLAFIDKIMKDTIEKKITWILESRTFFIDNLENQYFEHPLFHCTASRRFDDDEGEGYIYYLNKYRSKFNDSDDIELCGDCYYANLKGIDASIYLMQVVKKVFQEGKKLQKVGGFELYLVPKGKGANPVCCTYDVPEVLKEKICALFDLISLRKSGIMMTEDSENLIDLYLNS